MDEIDAYQKNQRVFLRGIDTSLQKNPYRMNADELNALECELNKAGALLGGIAVLVEWGQPFGGPVSAVKYHLAAEIIDLVDTYEKSGLKGICPKAGLVISYDWIDKQYSFEVLPKGNDVGIFEVPCKWVT